MHLSKHPRMLPQRHHHRHQHGHHHRHHRRHHLMRHLRHHLRHHLGHHQGRHHARPHSSPKPASTRVSQAQAWSHTSPTVSSSLSQSEAGYPTTPVQDAKSWWKGSSSRFSSKGEASPRASPKDSPSRSRHDNTREANPWWKMSSPRRSSSSSRAATLQNASPKPSSTKLQHQCAHEPAEGDARSKQKNSSSRGFSRELFADRKAEEVGIHQTAATCQTEPDEVKALADELLSVCMERLWLKMLLHVS